MGLLNRKNIKYEVGLLTWLWGVDSFFFSAKDYMKLSKLPFVHLLLGIIVFGTVLSISSSHWMILWIGLELNLIGFLPVMVVHGNYSGREAAVKYFIVQRLGSILLLLGRICSYSVSFTWDSLAGREGALFVIGGLLAKLGCAPFHMWLPGVMANLSWIPCLMIATWQKVAPLMLLTVLRITYKPLIILVSVFSVLWGGLGGINQTQLRALLGYSSIAHLGWMLIASTVNLSLLITYLFFYTFITGIVFVALWVVGRKDRNSLQGFGGSKRNIGIIVLLLSLAGLPPLMGFIPKLLVISSAAPTPALWLPLLVIVLGSVLSIYYYLYLFYALFIGEEGNLSYFINKVEYRVVIRVVVSLLGGLLILLL